MNFNVLLLFLTEILVVKYQLELTMIFIFFLSFGKTMGNFDLTTFLFDHISHFFTNSTTILTKFHEWISFSQWFFFKWISCISFKFLQLCTSNDNLKFKFEKNYRKKRVLLCKFLSLKDDEASRWENHGHGNSIY